MDAKKHGLKSATVTSLPSFYKVLKDVACFEGTPVVLECYVRGYPLPEVRWEKAGKLIGNSRNVRIEREGGRCRLHVKICTQKESGRYTCLAQNKEGLAQTSAVINVFDSSASLKLAQNHEVGISRSRSARGERSESSSSNNLHKTSRCSSISPTRKEKSDESKQRSGVHPPHFLSNFRRKIASEGECVRFSCTVTGSPRPTVRWKRNDHADSCLTEKVNGRIVSFKKGNSHILEIKDVTKEDAGTYVAIAENCAGKTEMSIRLEVRGSVKNVNNLKSKKSPTRWMQKRRSMSGELSPASEQGSITNGRDEKTSGCSSETDITRHSKTTSDVKTNEDSFAEEKLLNNRNYELESSTATLKKQDFSRGDEAPKANGTLRSGSLSAIETSVGSGLSQEDGGLCTRLAAFVQELKDVDVSDGESVTLTATIKDDIGIQKVVWLRNKQEIHDCPNFHYVTSADGKSFSLVIADVFPEDGGEYACVVTTSDNLELRTTCRLGVKAKVQNDVINHDLPSDSAPNVSEIGNCNFVPEQQEDNTSLLETTNGVNLIDDPCSQEEEKGCLKLHEEQIIQEKWSSKNGAHIFAKAEDHTQDRVSRVRRYTPAQILKGPQSLAVLRGETVILRTHFIGTSPVKVTWLKGGKIISKNQRISITVEEGMSVLTVRDVMADDSGKYVVSVENEGGSDCHFASVAVEGPPYPPSGQPTISDVTSHSLVVSWYGSAYDGGSVITGYIVEMCVLPDGKWTRISASCHSTSYHVRDLLPNRQYMFRVRAENVHGVSDPGMESEPVMLSDDAAEEEEELEDFAPFEHRVVEIDDTLNFEDCYELKDEVGKGRFGIVYKCLERSTGEERAAKVIRCVKSRDKQKVRDEVAIMNRLRHPKLLQLAAAFEKPREIILVTEFISGGELFERVIADDFVLTERDCILFMRQICEGVRYMHANFVIHLDLKPENILCKTQTSHQIKIIDFGLARIYNPAEKLHVLFGTPEFVAPEVINYEPVSLASDMWSLGVICYVLLSGLSPFMGDTDTETFSNITRAEFDFDDEAFDDISDYAKEFISMLLLKVPEKRMTAEECLQHRWLSQERHKMKGVQLSTDKLKKFIIRRKWQKTGNAIRALGRIQSLSGYSSGRSSLGSFSSYSSMTSESSDTHSNNCVGKHPKEAIKEQEEDAYFSGGSSHGDAEENAGTVANKPGHKKSHGYKSHDSDYASVEAPSFQKTLPKTKRVLNGENVTLEIQVDGGPEPEVVWLKGDAVLEKNEKYKISQASDGIWFLEILNCQDDDEDEYTCVALNRAGHVSTSTMLYVDPPDTEH